MDISFPRCQTNSVVGEVTRFGELLRERRQARGISQPALAKRSGVSEGHIALLELGDRGKRIRRDTVVKLAQGSLFDVAEVS